MRLIESFLNKYNNITYNTYELENGIKVLHLINPATVDFDFSVVFKAGHAYEDIENVPRGTAHFLEHMLFNPNTSFKDKNAIDKFEQGDKERPAIYINGFTTRKYIYFTSHSNEAGTDRCLQRISSLLEFPKKKFSKYIEKERNVVIAERNKRAKAEKDNTLAYLSFIYKGVLDHFTGAILGEIESIKTISLDNLEHYFKNRFVGENTTFAIQSKQELKKEVWQQIQKIANNIQAKPSKSLDLVIPENEYKVKCFRDDRATGITLDISYFKKEEIKTDYKKAIQFSLLNSLLNRIGYDILREKLGLIYDLSNYRSFSYSLGFSIVELILTTDKTNFEKLLSALYKLLTQDSFKFLNSRRGRDWFNSAISEYIYPRTTRFESELAENTVTSLLEKDDVFNYNKAVKEAKKISIKDVKEILSEIVNTPPTIWIESDCEDKYIYNTIEKSDFSKAFKTKNK